MKIFEGIIIATSMQKTATVEVVRKTPHPLYRKLMTKRKKYKVDTNGLSVIVGNWVKIVETRPISKGKHFKILKVLSKEKENKKTTDSEAQKITTIKKSEDSVVIKKGRSVKK